MYFIFVMKMFDVEYKFDDQCLIIIFDGRG